MSAPKLLQKSVLILSLIFPTLLNAGVLFFDDFSDNSAGWTLGETWSIGPAQPGCNGPGLDYTNTIDNGIAGTSIGGCNPTGVHDFYYLVSPVIDTSAVTGSLTLEFYRWLYSDYFPYAQNRIDVFDGNAWSNIFLTGGAPGVNDGAWVQQVFDITAYSNNALQVRFGHNIGSSGAFPRPGWHIDNFSVFCDGNNCLGTDGGGGPSPLPTPSSLALLLGAGLLLMVRRRTRKTV